MWTAQNVPDGTFLFCNCFQMWLTLSTVNLGYLFKPSLDIRISTGRSEVAVTTSRPTLTSAQVFHDMWGCGWWPLVPEVMVTWGLPDCKLCFHHFPVLSFPVLLSIFPRCIGCEKSHRQVNGGPQWSLRWRTLPLRGNWGGSFMLALGGLPSWESRAEGRDKASHWSRTPGWLSAIWTSMWEVN